MFNHLLVLPEKLEEKTPLDIDLSGEPLLVTPGLQGLETTKELDLVGGFSCVTITQARELLGRLHKVRCDTSFTTFSKQGRTEHADDWSASTHFLAGAVIEESSHVFLLECACNATVDMVCSYVHNFIVAHINKFTFELRIEGIEDSAFISELDEEPIEFQIIPLISHNGCLHPIGEPCFCSDFSDSEPEGGTVE